MEFKTAAVLVDAGGSYRAGVKEHLLAYLDDFFKRRPDLNNTLYSVIVTHPHTDHTIYLMDVMRRYRVTNFVDNGDTRQRGSWRDLKAAREFIDQLNQEQPLSAYYNKIDAEDIAPSGYLTGWFKQLKNSPSKAEITFLNASRDCKNPNNDSLVVLVKYKKTKLLIAGDAEWDTEDETCTPPIQGMLARFGSGSLMDIDVYKVGHHGAVNGTNDDYLRKMSPKISVISAGATDDDNAKSYGHPRMSVVEELFSLTENARPAKQVYARERADGNPVAVSDTKAVYCTCWDGDIVISTDAAGKLKPVQTSN